MSTLASLGESPADAVTGKLSPALSRVLAVIDVRMHGRVIAHYEAARAGASTSNDGGTTVPGDRQVVLVGHRAAGKSRALPVLADLVRREAIDLDRELERVHQRAVRDWVTQDLPSFRAAERALFTALRPGSIVAVGGGFWSQHGEVLAGHTVVQIPVSFRTYRERLLSDASRPRLVSDVSIEEEIRTVYRSREFAHRPQPHWSLGAFVAAVEQR